MIFGFFLACLSIALMIGGLYGLVNLLGRLQEILSIDAANGLEQEFEQYEQELEEDLPPFALHPECFDSNGNIIKEPWMFFVFKRVEE